MKKLKTILKSTAALGLVMGSLALSGCGCGNNDLFDMNFTFNYIVTEENGQHVLHEVESWSDSESESATVSTKCCGNYIWCSANKDKMYENKPGKYAYDVECEQIN